MSLRLTTVFGIPKGEDNTYIENLMNVVKLKAEQLDFKQIVIYIRDECPYMYLAAIETFLIM